MATNTTKLALSKPDGTDLVDIAVLNTNFDKIDAASGATICTSSTRPASPWNGQVIFETDTLNALVYRTSTTSWNILGGSTVASEPPAGAGNGNFWWDSDNGKLYIYYNDGNSGQWVSVMPSTTAVDVSQNYIINGGFDIWQRGTSTTTTAAGYRTADRWATWISAGSGTVQLDTTYPAPGCENGIRFTSSAAGSNIVYYYTLETKDAIRLAGKTVNFSTYVASPSSKSIQLSIWSSTTVDNSFTGSWDAVSSTTVTGTSTLTRQNLVGSIPANAKTVQVRLFITGVNNTEFASFSGAQLEIGSITTSFRRNQPNIQGELAACQRYYEIGKGLVRAAGVPTGANYYQIWWKIPFKVTKRASATMATTINSGGSFGFSADTSEIYANAQNNGTTDVSVDFTWAAAAEL